MQRCSSRRRGLGRGLDSLGPCRYLAPLGMAAAALEDCEDWAGAADAQHLIALVCDTAPLQPQRNLAASSWQRLAARACSVSF